jgi:hypothetical protein
MRGRRASEQLSRLVLVWAGVAIGVAFVATPAKFLAPSLSLAVALDVGRHTFAVFNRLELLLLSGLSVLALFASRRWAWLAALALPGVIVLAQTIWLIPALDIRVEDILAGGSPSRSNLHGLYIAAEAAEVAALVLIGFLGPRVTGRPPAPTRPLPWTRSTRSGPRSESSWERVFKGCSAARVRTSSEARAFGREAD